MQSIFYLSQQGHATGHIPCGVYLELLEQLKDSRAEVLIRTKSDLVIRDIDLLKERGKGTVSWSINTLDEDFWADMDKAVSIERRLHAMEQVYIAGIQTVCFITPVFPVTTDFEAISQRVKNPCDLVRLENLNLRGGSKQANFRTYLGKGCCLNCNFQVISVRSSCRNRRQKTIFPYGSSL